MGKPDFLFELAARAAGAGVIAGVDEAGRGPLAGPVIAAAVRLHADRIPPGLNDSKQMTAPRRRQLCALILATADVGIGQATVEEIDRINILRASHLAMCRAVAALRPAPDHVLIDGNMIPRGLSCRAEAIISGDARCLSIAAASIVAKVTRDRIMVDLAQQHPGYGWDRNAGYPTRDHIAALRNLGVTPAHRRSFRPVHKMLYQDVSLNP
ncbi:MAG: ribonuclease HII [Rhodobacter sp.]|nr:ribonuclease HII [Rhodobacter sp.]MCA3514525.1 ribonuclease HII [Rhodobacter sp.]MCA3518667.1 ribonuclease HII [Rhodobacter sp.]MCA3523592.1 ribonuclease HII [Rhodobacter sp.]MCA3526096.1 ribonuclease HII [Rhodobacter sp.]